MRLLSLCSGYGGLDLAVESVYGAKVVAHAEIDPHAAKVFETHWPVPNLGDLTRIDWPDLEPVDVITAGFPCQPISVAGQRKVTNDARWIWPHIADAVRVLRPRLVVLENVDALLRVWRDDDGWWNPAPIEEVTADLAGSGYVGSWRCVRASDIGAPHRRSRVFIVAADADRSGTGGEGRAVLGAPGERPWGQTDVPPVDDGPVAADPDRQGLEGPGGLHRPSREVQVAPCHQGAPADGPGFRWGPYGPAIRRWERLTRPAPAFVDERGQLAAPFVEWMMGLPTGWVTDAGLSRSAQIRILGNGVVPQQAAYALEAMR